MPPRHRAALRKGAASGVLGARTLLVTLAGLGMTVSTLTNNAVIAVVAVTLIWLNLGVVLSLPDVSFRSPANSVEQLPNVITGEFSEAEQ